MLYPAPQLHQRRGRQDDRLRDRRRLPVEVTPQDPGKPVKLQAQDRLRRVRETVRAGEGRSRAHAQARHCERADAALDGARGARAAKSSSRAGRSTCKRVSDGAEAAGRQSISPRRPMRRSRSSSKARRRTGPCRSRSRRKARPPGRRAFGFELDGLPPGTDPNRPARPAPSPSSRAQRAIEVATRLD